MALPINLVPVPEPSTQSNFDEIKRQWPVEPFRGSGSPEGVITGGPGATYVDTATGTTWVRHASGSGSTGWVPSSGSRGAAIIATQQARTDTAYGTLATPDSVTVALPSNGLIVIAYQATWFESVAGAARAAVFIGANQLQTAGSSITSPVVQETSTGRTVAVAATPLSSCTFGLRSEGDPASGVAYGGDVTTGQVVGNGGAGLGYGALHVFAAPGTYAVSVQYKASSGSVTALTRKLWVWVEPF
jgi:hypothetical protein